MVGASRSAISSGPARKPLTAGPDTSMAPCARGRCPSGPFWTGWFGTKTPKSARDTPGGRLTFRSAVGLPVLEELELGLREVAGYRHVPRIRRRIAHPLEDHVDVAADRGVVPEINGVLDIRIEPAVLAHHRLHVAVPRRAVEVARDLGPVGEQQDADEQPGVLVLVVDANQRRRERVHLAVQVVGHRLAPGLTLPAGI